MTVFCGRDEKGGLLPNELFNLSLFKGRDDHRERIIIISREQRAKFIITNSKKATKIENIKTKNVITKSPRSKMRF